MTISVASTTGFAANDYIEIDSEIVKIDSVLDATRFHVFRSQFGTTAAKHVSGASVIDIAPGASSIYFTFGANAVTAAACNGTTGVGCAVRTTQGGPK